MTLNKETTYSLLFSPQNKQVILSCIKHRDKYGNDEQSRVKEVCKDDASLFEQQKFNNSTYVKDKGTMEVQFKSEWKFGFKF